MNQPLIPFLVRSIRFTRLVAAVLAACACCVGSKAQTNAGDVIFQTGFEEANVLQQWRAEANPRIHIVRGFNSAHAIEVDGSTKADSIHLALPIEAVRGARLRCEAMAKADSVSAPPNPWNGIKFMLHVSGPAGSIWPQPNNVSGTFDWKRLQFNARIPKDATAAEIILGLEAVTGIVAFDDIRITVLNPRRPEPAAVPSGRPYTGHGQARLRGAMIGQNLTAADLREFGEQWHANHVRWQLLWGGFPHSPADDGDLAAYDKWMEGQVKRLDELLPVCKEAGLTVLIDVHTPPGGRSGASECRLFHEKRFQESFLSWWDKLSKHFRGNRTVWGYDLVNEPLEGTVGEGCMGWQELATAAARVVRTNDAEHAIIVEPEPWGGPDSMDNLSPIPVPGVVYSAHMYLPHKFTHQVVYNKTTGLSYPGVIDGVRWDKERLRKALQPVVDFQRAYGVHIYIGEFSAIRWAPDESACRYLRDCIEIFEENGWDWAYHAFREWDGWSVEHGPDPSDHARAKIDTCRAALLKEWFRKNEH